MIRAVFVFSALLAVALLVSGCAGSSLSQAEQQSLAEAATAPTKLQPGDKIRITVFGEDKLSGDYQLDQSGQISLPLAGTLKALGLTQTELEQALAKKFRSQYLKNPKVTVTITTLRPFYIVGEVEKPGEYPYKSGLNVLTALADRWWSHISSKPYYSSDPATWRDRYARLSHIGIGSSLARRCNSSS